MSPEKRNIQIVLDKLWIEYSQLYQKVNNLDYHLSKQVCSANNIPHSLDLLYNQYEAMKTYLDILKERIDDLSKQFKECK